MKLGRLHLLTDYYFQQQFAHHEMARLAIHGGATTIQFRQKHGDVKHVLHEAQRTAEICRSLGVPLIVDDRIDLTLAVEADGVHLGQRDFPVGEARRILGDQAIIGATATTVEQALRAEAEGASYIGFGPVYPTASKRSPASVKGLRRLAEVTRRVELPVIAIAGITAERVAEVMQTGAFGIAVMTAITLAENPEEATRRLRAAIDEALSS